MALPEPITRKEMYLSKAATGDCTAITSAVPELWDTAKWQNVTNHSGCFYNCTNAANYADIPEGWK